MKSFSYILCFWKLLDKKKIAVSFGIPCAWKLSLLPAICCRKLTLRATPFMIVRLYFSVHEAAKLFPDSLASLLQISKQWKKKRKKIAIMGSLSAYLLNCTLQHRALGITQEKCWCAICIVPTEWVTCLSCYPAHLLTLHLQKKKKNYSPILYSGQTYLSLVFRNINSRKENYLSFAVWPLGDSRT